MSSTNKTTNYELSQFIGTDKPAWLTDYNSDMSKIDAGVHSAKSTADGADGKATANATAIGTLSNLTTEAKTNLVAAVNEVDANADTALNTASNAAGNATNAINKVNALADYLTLSSTTIDNTKVVPNDGAIASASTSVTVATNNTASLGKVYGRIVHVVTSVNTTHTITLNIDSGIHPDAEFTISPAGLGYVVVVNGQPTAYQHLKIVSLTFKPNGNILVKYYAESAGTYALTLFPCVYFFEDFGDVES